MSQLDERIVNVFCKRYGEKYRTSLSEDTDMDSVAEWDSLNFIEFVLDLEEEFELEFTESETAQMFQLGHVQRIVNSARMDLPHDDISHSICQLKQIQDSPAEQIKIVILSTSSTREGLIGMREMNALIQQSQPTKTISLFNLSVSGMKLGEMLQLSENLKNVNNIYLLLGLSPFVLGGCQANDFESIAQHQRFPLSAPLMDSVLSEAGYDVFIGNDIPIETWVTRYLKGKNIEELIYNPYLYPTLEPWNSNHFGDRKTLVTFYNDISKCWEESTKINELLFSKWVNLCQIKAIPFGVIELPLHSVAQKYFDEIGGLCMKTKALIRTHVKSGLRVISTDARIDISDSDFRDYGHIFQKKEAYSKALIDCIAEWIENE